MFGNVTFALLYLFISYLSGLAMGWVHTTTNQHGGILGQLAFVVVALIGALFIRLAKAPPNRQIITWNIVATIFWISGLWVFLGSDIKIWEKFIFYVWQLPFIGIAIQMVARDMRVHREPPTEVAAEPDDDEDEGDRHPTTPNGAQKPGYGILAMNDNLDDPFFLIDGTNDPTDPVDTPKGDLPKRSVRTWSASHGKEPEATTGHAAFTEEEGKGNFTVERGVPFLVYDHKEPRPHLVEGAELPEPGSLPRHLRPLSWPGEEIAPIETEEAQAQR